MQTQKMKRIAQGQKTAKSVVLETRGLSLQREGIEVGNKRTWRTSLPIPNSAVLRW